VRKKFFEQTGLPRKVDIPLKDAAGRKAIDHRLSKTRSFLEGKSKGISLQEYFGA